MNEKPKSIWKKSWTGWRGLFFGWLILMATLAVILLIWLVVERTLLVKSADEAGLFLFFGLVVTVIFLLVASIRWLCCWRNFKRFLFGLACLATLVALAYAEEDWRGWHAWNQFKHEWEAKGEKFDWQSIVPPPVPDDQNFAMAPIWVESIKSEWGTNIAKRWYGENLTEPERAKLVDRLNLTIWGDQSQVAWPTDSRGSWQTAQTSDLKIWQNYYRVLAATTNEFPVASQPQTPAQDVLLALSKFDPAIEELRQASELSYSRFPLNYDSENPAVILLPHLAALKRCAQVLRLRAIAELQNGQSDKALDDVKLMLYLANSIRTEPFLISQLVHVAMLQIALQPVYEGLAEHNWSEAQLAALDTELAKFDFLADYKLSMRGEMGLQGGNIDYLIRNRRELFNMTSGNGASSGPPFVSSLIPTGWFYRNRLGCARMMVEFYIPLADVNRQTISPAAVRQADKALQAETKKITPYNILERLLLPALGNAVKHFAYAQSSVDLARVAIALERYRLAHGEYPESLDALAPQFITKVPHDVIGGQPLHYRLTSDGQFVLYSVGWNETDDGGVVVNRKSRDPRDENGNTPDISQGDWVWRYPQK